MRTREIKRAFRELVWTLVIQSNDLGLRHDEKGSDRTRTALTHLRHAGETLYGKGSMPIAPPPKRRKRK